MKFSQEDWKIIQPALLIFLVVILCAFLLLVYEQNQKQISASALERQQQAFTQASNRFIRSGEEKASIKLNLPKYQALLNQGAVGEERRIEWVDALRNIHKENKLFSIKFSIGPQSIYHAIPAKNIEPFKAYHSQMKIELALLHENDLFTLFDELKRKNLAPFLIKQCEMTRQNANIGNSLTANILAKCDLDWITVHEPIAQAKTQ